MSFRGQKVLVVEDEVLIGHDLAMTLRDWGCEPVGPATTARGAIELLEDQQPDFAILDVNLGPDQTCERVADRLEQSGVPFVFMTGYGSGGTKELRRHSGAPRLGKPLNYPELRHAMESALVV